MQQTQCNKTVLNCKKKLNIDKYYNMFEYLKKIKDLLVENFGSQKDRNYMLPLI